MLERTVRSHGTLEREEPEELEISALWLVNALLRRRNLLVALPLIAVIAALVLALRREPAFVAESVFMPQAPPSATSRVAGLAAQFGVSVGAGASGYSPEFYARLLDSRELLRAAVLTQYTLPAGAGRPDSLQGDLTELLEVEGAGEEQRVRAAVGRLRDMLAVNTERTGLVRVQSSAPQADLAVQVNRRMLDLLNEFLVERRQSQATAERRFVEARLGEAQGELAAAEEALERFLDGNRSYQSSPQLAFEASRLQRRVDLRQQVYSALAQSYEQVRIEEVRDMPVITIVDRPEGSARRQASSLVGAVAMAFAVGLLLAVALAVILELSKRHLASHPREYEEFLALRRTPMRWMDPRGLWTRASFRRVERDTGTASGSSD